MMIEYFLVSFFGGLVGVVLPLWYIVTYLRPKLVISPFISQQNELYRFKIVNKSRYNALEVKVELFAMQPYPLTDGNYNIRIFPIEIVTSSVTVIERFRSPDSQKDPFALYARTFFTVSNIREELSKNGTYLLLVVTARHGLTGLVKTFQQSFANTNNIKIGHKFEFGKSLNTMPQHN